MGKEFNTKNVRKQLKETYIAWVTALIESDFYGGKDLSNPYLCGVPDGWCESPIRVMVCGREGNGELMKDENGNPVSRDISNKTQMNNFIEKAQENNLKYVSGGRITYWKENNKTITGEWSFQNDTHAFAKAFREIQVGLDTIPIIWNECDKICHTDYRGYHDTNALTSDENDKLHSIDKMDILQEEIKILLPTHIIFLGYWRQSLKIKKKTIETIFPKDKTYDKGIWYKMKDYETYVCYCSHPQYKGQQYFDMIKTIIQSIKDGVNVYNTMNMIDYDEDKN